MSISLSSVSFSKSGLSSIELQGGFEKPSSALSAFGLAAALLKLVRSLDLISDQAWETIASKAKEAAGNHMPDPTKAPSPPPSLGEDMWDHVETVIPFLP